MSKNIFSFAEILLGKIGVDKCLLTFFQISITLKVSFVSDLIKFRFAGIKGHPPTI
ncbi:MAG: hypothetical protein HYV51_00615 [Parcubacteria group bacterium]|nr:hypothetical protein [Parcubacteria group bacterium]